MALKKVLVNFIQDRSGSMATCWDETLNGYTEFVKDLKKKGAEDGVEYSFSLTTFDTLIETPYVAKAISEVAEDCLKNYGPRGSTALYDAVGKTIENTDKIRNGADKIICVIVTDGQENSSREWSKDALQKSIESHLQQGDWTFTYLGTQPETWDDAQRLGLAIGATATYDSSNARAAYANVSSRVHTMAASSLQATRNLMNDSQFGDLSKVAAAGINIKPDSTATTPHYAPPPPLPTSRKAQRRWR